MIKYARGSDYVAGGLTAAAGPTLMLLWERVAPSQVGKGGFAPIMRLAGAIGFGAGFLHMYQRSICMLSNFVDTIERIIPVHTLHKIHN